VSTAFVGYAHARLGQRSYAFRVLDQLRAASKQRYVPALSFAIVYVGLGEKEQALLWLEKAYDERTNSLAYLRATHQIGKTRVGPQRVPGRLHVLGGLCFALFSKALAVLLLARTRCDNSWILDNPEVTAGIVICCTNTGLYYVTKNEKRWSTAGAYSPGNWSVTYSHGWQILASLL
jgi:hypothetical protein